MTPRSGNKSEAALMTDGLCVCMCVCMCVCVFLSVDSGMTTEDSFDERGCHCDITVEDLSAPLKTVIRAVR